MNTSSSSDDSLNVNLQSPPSRRCADCHADSYSFERGPLGDLRVHYIIIPCSKHENNIFSSPVAAQRWSPSPTTIPTLSTATRRPAPSSSRAASIPVNSSDPSSTSQSSPQPSTSQSSPPPCPAQPSTPTCTNRYRARRKASIPEDALLCYNNVLRNLHGGKTITDAVKKSNTSWRVWERKRYIAELMILDRPKFDSLLAGGSVTQQKLSDDCKAVLARSDYTKKRRDGRLNGSLV